MKTISAKITHDRNTRPTMGNNATINDQNDRDMNATIITVVDTHDSVIANVRSRLNSNLDMGVGLVMG
jgi:hypothetical protein